MEDIVKRLISLEKELKTLQSSSDDEKSVIQSAKIIRDEITALNDELPWPPKPADFNVANFKLSIKLELFLQNLLSGKHSSSDSHRIGWLKLSFGQDLIHAISCGKIKTPKSILYPYTIKALTNNTELITITNRFGHGVS